MTDKNNLRKKARTLFSSFLTASLCAGLILTGCGSNTSNTSNTADVSEQTETASGSSSSDAAGASSADAAAVSDAAAGKTAAPENAAALAATGESASAADTGDQYADPGWSDEQAEINFSAEGKGLVIVIDPGCASQVPGTTEPIGPGSAEMKEADTEGSYGPSSGLHEYDLTMKVSRKLRTELEERGYEVKLTHYDTFTPVSYTERAAVANENKADAFIRIHANASEDTGVHGAGTVCITKDNPYHPELYSSSLRLSETLLETYCKATGAEKEKVVETDEMAGNNWAEVPTTLIRLGYMTNPDEDLDMNSDSYHNKMVKGIADGLDRWFAEMPEEELSMHPSLTAENGDASDTASTAGTSSEATEAGDGDGTGGTGSTEAGPDAADSSTGDTAAAENTAGDTGSAADNAADTDSGTDTGNTQDQSGTQTSPEETGGSTEGTPAAPAASTPGTAAGTSSGNGTGVSTDTGSDSE